jgi:hypothetical protein
MPVVVVDKSGQSPVIPTMDVRVVSLLFVSPSNTHNLQQKKRRSSVESTRLGHVRRLPKELFDICHILQASKTRKVDFSRTHRTDIIDFQISKDQ